MLIEGSIKGIVLVEGSIKSSQDNKRVIIMKVTGRIQEIN